MKKPNIVRFSHFKSGYAELNKERKMPLNKSSQEAKVVATLGASKVYGDAIFLLYKRQRF
ncbi:MULTISPECIES: hypothetical protein [unclassified Bartonella]|uniref:hypothetical protein n=1 Tax=unclassified Bartonella TaxID=2645622 RepID=UPI0035D10B85